MLKNALAMACAALSMAGSATAATATNWKVEAFGKISSVRTLLNDGRLVGTYNVFTFPDPSTCAPSHYPTTCSYPSTYFTGLQIFTPGQEVPQKLSDNFWGRGLFINHAGKALTWTPYAGEDFTVLDLATGQSTLFASGSSVPAISMACYSNNGAFWRSWSDGGVLAGQPAFDCPDKANSIFLWTGGTSTQEITPPKGYEAVRFVGINASSQVVANGGSPKAFNDGAALLWNKATGYKVLPTPLLNTLLGYTRSNATAINDAGDVVGYLSSKKSSAMRAMLWRAGTATDIGARSGYKYSYAAGVTSKGVVIGCGNNVGIGAGPAQLFLWDQNSSKAWSASSTADGTPVTAADYCGQAYSLSNAKFIANQSGQWLLDQALPADPTLPAAVYLVSPLK